MKTRSLAATAVLAAGFALGLTIPAGAQALPCAPSTGSVSASTTLTGRPDFGGNGNWATDKLTRTLKYTLISHAGGVYTYNATVCDGGTFAAIPGAFTPNQSGSNLGDTIRDATTGMFTGTATYTFTSDAAVNIALVQPRDDGTPAAGTKQTTSLWFEQGFASPADILSGGINDNWSWSYTNFTQTWTDAASNSGGQTASAGNITG